MNEPKTVTDGAVTEKELEAIARYSRRPLTAGEVYTFPLVLCDNDLDRDNECFTDEALEKLAELFCGKTGIFDHDPRGEKQTARIYRCRVEPEDGRLNYRGDPYKALKADAYMVRTAANADLILEIDGGIKKEVSVGCAVQKNICSICGADRREEPCGHQPGKRYGGKLCCTLLAEPTDAYEWSFVAVPAQPRAGVLKRHGGGTDGTLGTLVKQYGSPAQARELETLEQQAGQGRRYLEALRGEVKRLMLTAEQETDGAVIEAMTGKLGEEELCALERIYRKRALKRLGLRTQLVYGETKTAAEDENDFRV